MLKGLYDFPFIEVNNNRLPGIAPNEKVVSPVYELDVKQDVGVSRRYFGNGDIFDPSFFIANVVQFDASIDIPSCETKTVGGKGRGPTAFVDRIRC